MIVVATATVTAVGGSRGQRNDGTYFNAPNTLDGFTSVLGSAGKCFISSLTTLKRFTSESAAMGRGSGGPGGRNYEMGVERENPFQV
jgi:hypothetical protein